MKYIVKFSNGKRRLIGLEEESLKEILNIDLTNSLLKFLIRIKEIDEFKEKRKKCSPIGKRRLLGLEEDGNICPYFHQINDVQGCCYGRKGEPYTYCCGLRSECECS